MSFCYHQYSCDGSESTISYSLLLTGFFFFFLNEYTLHVRCVNDIQDRYCHISVLAYWGTD